MFTPIKKLPTYLVIHCQKFNPEIQSSGETLIPRISHPENTINNDRKIADNIIKY
jgi:hypothetical protein